MKEIWKDIEGYENRYKISNYGKVKSLYRKVKFPKGFLYSVPEKILNPGISSQGYHFVNLTKYGKQKGVRVHRLVALSFIPNPQNKRCINHKNGIKADNRVENLEWATHSENNKHAYDIGLKIGALKNKFGKDNYKSKPVIQFAKNNKFIKNYDSIKEATRVTGVNNISVACRGIQKTAGGFIWRFKKKTNET